MADLDTFDDRTIKRARNRFTNGKRGSGDDPIATHAKVAQDVMLGHLRALVARAEDGAYDTHAGLQGETDADSLIDPFLSYDENVAEIQAEYGVTFRTYAERERKDKLKDADEQARRHARETLRERFEAIQAGEADGLVRDISAEFGEDFVADVLGRERDIRETPEPERAPEPEPVEAPEPAIDEPEPAAPEPEPEAPATAGGGSAGGVSGLLATLSLLASVFAFHAKTERLRLELLVHRLFRQIRQDAETVALAVELFVRKQALAIQQEAIND